LNFITAITKELPRLACATIELLGTMPPGPDSFTSGIKSFMSETLYNIEFFFAVIPIKAI